MRRFVMKITLFGLAVVLSNLLFYVLLPLDRDNGSYLAAINDKYAILASTPAPRIIFVGSSDLAFGLDSARIKQATGMNVVNLGLHAGLGARFPLEAIRQEIQPGDIVIISSDLVGMVNISFYGNDDGAGVHLWLLKFRPETLRFLDTPNQWLLMVQEYTSFIRSMRQTAQWTGLQEFYPQTPGPTIAYRRDGFNEYGDLVAHLDLPSTPWPVPLSTSGPAWTLGKMQFWPATDAPAYFNDYAAFVKARGAEIYSISPPRALKFTPEPEKLVVAPEAAALIDIPMLGSPVDFVYPDDYFYDAAGHLTRIGRAERTEQIIRELAKVMKQP